MELPQEQTLTNNKIPKITIALLLIILPIVGFYLGMIYQQNITLKEELTETQSNTPQEQQNINQQTPTATVESNTSININESTWKTYNMIVEGDKKVYSINYPSIMELGGSQLPVLKYTSPSAGNLNIVLALAYIHGGDLKAYVQEEYRNFVNEPATTSSIESIQFGKSQGFKFRSITERDNGFCDNYYLNSPTQANLFTTIRKCVSPSTNNELDSIGNKIMESFYFNEDYKLSI